MKERNFKFRKSYAEVIRVMDDKQAGRFIKAVSDYVFDGRAYDGNDTAIKSAFTLVKVSLDGDKADRENGRRGGIKSRELRKAKEEQPDLQIIIFSGFSDFAFAQEAIRYGVTEYILKPVNPEDFHRVIQRAEVTIASRIKKESREIKEKIFLQQYFLQNYLYSGKKEVLEKAGELIDLNKWNDWHCAILLESDVAFFDTAEENLD